MTQGGSIGSDSATNFVANQWRTGRDGPELATFGKPGPRSNGNGRVIYPFQCRDEHGALKPTDADGSRKSQCRECLAIRIYDKCLLADPDKKRRELGLAVAEDEVEEAEAERVCATCGETIETMPKGSLYCYSCRDKKRIEHVKKRNLSKRKQRRQHGAVRKSESKEEVTE